MTQGKSLNLCFHAHRQSLNKRTAQFHLHTLLESLQTKSVCPGWRALKHGALSANKHTSFMTMSDLSMIFDANISKFGLFFFTQLNMWKICNSSWSLPSRAPQNYNILQYLFAISNLCDSAPDCCKPMKATDACECSIMAQSLSHCLKDWLNGLVYYWPREAEGFCQR